MDYRSIAPMMGALWSPIAAVTTAWHGQRNAQIAVAIAAASIVPDKSRVVLQIYKTNHTHGMILQSRAFALNFLEAIPVGVDQRLRFCVRPGTGTNWRMCRFPWGCREARCWMIVSGISTVGSSTEWTAAT